jgi:ABC-2 type transport system ATP-binding protein
MASLSYSGQPVANVSAGADYAITATHLAREFGAVKALRDLSLTVPTGHIFGFLGPNGAGKTTTIRLLLGLLEPTHGEARVLGHDPRTDGPSIREQCGALLEFNGLYESLSAADNLEFYGRIYGMPRDERRRRIAESLALFGLADRAGDRAGTLSRGMQQKLAIARAILHHPRLLFLDEPTDGLDPAAAAAVRQDLLDLVAREQVTVFLTTHHLGEAEQICANVGILRRGELVASGTPEALRASLAPPQVRITGSGFSPAILAGLRADPAYRILAESPGMLLVQLRRDEDAGDLVSALTASGVRVRGVEPVLPSFEAAFLQLVQDQPEGRDVQ